MILSIETPSDIRIGLAKQLKSKRAWMKHSRAQAAKLSGVPTPTIRRFEDSGEISLHQLLMLAHVYGDLSAFKKIFPPEEARTMDDLIKLRGHSKT